MRINHLLLLALIALTSCEYSGLKAAITSNFVKILTKYDLNKYLQNKTLIDYTEASGSALFDYEVEVENLWMKYVKSPSNVTIDQETTEEGFPQVKITLLDIEVDIEIAHLYVEYGFLSDDFYEVDGYVRIESVESRYHFNAEGKLVVSEINVEIDELDIDVKKSFLNFLIGLFKGLIKSQITSQLEDLSGTLSEAFNNLMDKEIKFDIGYGISLNLTDTMRPNITQIFKGERFDIKLLKLMKAIIEKEELDEVLASVLTIGMKGSAFATADPSIHPDLTPVGEMDFNHDYFTNEVQILISTYTMDNLLYVSQKVGLLHCTFTNDSHPIFTFNFDTQGMQKIIPQYGDKYPNKSIPVEMAVQISPNGHNRAYVEMTDAGANLAVNFNLNLSTNGTQDLAINVTVNVPFTIEVKYDLLTINWGSINVTELIEQVNELKVPHEQLVTLIGTMYDTYLIKFAKQYTKNIAIAAILSLITGQQFKNFKLETHERHLLVSIGVKLD